MADLDDFLEHARAEGRLHSAGEFSLDVERANRLLRDYQLADRGYYLLKLVQAAVTGGASEINFTLRRDSVEATLFGRDLVFFDTRDVVAALTQTEVMQGDGPLSHLATALNAALALKPESIEWTVWNAWRQETLQLTREGSSFQRLYQRPWDSSLPGYRFRLERQPPQPPPQPAGMLSKFTNWLKEPARAQIADEHASLSRRCAYTPLIVTVDGRQVNAPLLCGDRERAQGQPNTLEAFFLDGGPNTFALAPVASRFAHNLKHGTFATHVLYCLQPDFEGQLSLTAPLQWSRGSLMLAVRPGKGFIRFIHHGIILDTVPEDDLEAVTSTVGLAVDLSQQAVVKNDSYDERLAAIRGLAKQLVRCRLSVTVNGLRRASNQFSEISKAVEAGEPLPFPLDAGNLELYPLYATIDASYLPPDADVEAVLYRHGALKSVKHRHIPGLELQLTGVAAQARLLSPQPAWPPTPPLEQSRWVAWVKGAIRCIVGGGLIQYGRQDLPGYLDDEDGIRATFYPDGQLETLACYRGGKPVGWQLFLHRGEHRGHITHAHDTWDEHYEPPQVWSTWVDNWIDCVYRDAQL